MADDLVTCHVSDDVALLTLNAPERRNGWTMAMGARYFDLLDECVASEDVRAIVLTGAGRTFCPGLDASGLSDIAGGQVSDPRTRRPETYARSTPKPIIAAINGACAGMGLLQALCCDVRFASPEAKFTTAFARRGLEAEHGMAWLLPRVVGAGRATDLLLSARVVLAQEAAEIGLVSRLSDHVLDDAMDYARDLARFCSPVAMRAIKSQVHDALEQSLEEARLNAIRLWVDDFTDHPDFREGVDSYMEKRPPAFAPITSKVG